MSRSLFCSRRPSKIAVLAEVLGVQSMQRRDVLRGSVLPHPGQGFFRLFGTREPPADDVMRCHASLIVAAHVQGLFR